jgi:hypothetical protein
VANAYFEPAALERMSLHVAFWRKDDSVAEAWRTAIRGRWEWPPAAPVSLLGSDELVYFEKGLFGGVCTFCVCPLCGSVPGGTSVELAGGVIGGVLPSWLYVMLAV